MKSLHEIKFVMKLLLCVFIICLCTQPSLSQDLSEATIQKIISEVKKDKSYSAEEEGPEPQIRVPTILKEFDISEGQSLALMKTLQDKEINPEEYYVGPGDDFLVYVWGKIEKTYFLQINNEGKLMIPLVGLLSVNGKTLAEAKIQIKNKINKIYINNINVVVILKKIREFKIYVMGEVEVPGSYLVNGMTRASDVILMCGGIKENGKWRAIEIQNDLYETRYVDLAAFFNSMDVDENPYLRSGDRIHVPPWDDFIVINGFVSYSGRYDFCKGDNLNDIISAAGGLSRGADSGKILINRFVNNFDSLITFEIGLTQTGDFEIKKDDRILICGIPEYRMHRQVEIKGEIKFPGIYPIRKDKTRLADIIIMAGGVTEDAFLKGSKIVRKYYSDVGDREFERLKAMPAESLTPLERSYLKTKLTEEDGIVSIDFEELLSDSSELYNIILRDKDEITIARKSLSIKVSGAVISPGLIGFTEGADYKHYIDRAGGVDTRARRRSVMIIKGGTERMLKPTKVKKLEAGDAVWVPEKEYKNRFNLTRDILLIAGSIATLVISAFTIQQFANK